MNQVDVFLPGIGALILVILTFIKWPLKGAIFHPGFIYALINAGMFVIFAFGPYIYPTRMHWTYCYMYVIIVSMYVAGIILGEELVRKKLIKPISLTKKQVRLLYILAIVFSVAGIAPKIIASGGNLQDAASNRLASIASGFESSESADIVGYILGSIQFAFVLLSNSVITSYTLLTKKRYLRILALFIVSILYALFENSRTHLFFALITIMVPAYIILKNQGIIDFSKLNWSKNFKFTVPVILTAILVIGILTNVRSSVSSTEKQISYERIEQTFQVTRRPWYDQIVNTWPSSVVTPLSELSIYAGGTVVIGGLLSDITIDSGLRAWGLRSLFAVHRLVAQLRLDGGLSNLARNNYNTIFANAVLEQPATLVWWFSDPGNQIIDFGYIGAAISSLIFGIIIGSIYQGICNSGEILKAVGTSVILIQMFLTPATSFLGFLPGTLNLVVITGYLLKNSRFKKK